jgi:hypothetical protein
MEYNDNIIYNEELTRSSRKRERERETLHLGGGKKLYFRFGRFPGSVRLSFWYG